MHGIEYFKPTKIQLIHTRHDFILSQCCCWTSKSSCVIGHVLPFNHQRL